MKECPSNKNHKEFVATAHVTQTWKVDNNGKFLESIRDCDNIIHSPNEEDVWVCNECGAIAITKQ